MLLVRTDDTSPAEALRAFPASARLYISDEPLQKQIREAVEVGLEIIGLVRTTQSVFLVVQKRQIEEGERRHTMGFGEEFKRVREEKLLTQAEAAKLVDRDTMTISRWERGEVVPEPLVQEAALARLRAARAHKERRWVILERLPNGRLVRCRICNLGFRTREAAREFLRTNGPRDGGWIVGHDPKFRTAHT
jgi:transcriptional regulator with XRE-family HTH domain